jgi:acetoin utilization deacetylase AcuC-like enzyme
MHYGDGTDEIIGELGIDWVQHYCGADYNRPAQAAGFLADLPRQLREMTACDLVLYQAGADPHIDDPLGGWLTTAELAARDAIVFEAFAERSIPVVWNLAGGYQREPDGSIPKVLEIHANTARAALRVLAQT